MKRAAKRLREIAAAQRGQMVQRVMVDGWSPARVATEFEVPERQVVRLVAAYRRRGMATLRSEVPPLRDPARSLQTALARISRWLRAWLGPSVAGRCVPLDRRDDDARRHR